MNAPLRAVGIVIKNNKVLLMERNKKGRHYYTFIGGGVEEGEDIEAAVIREVREESSLEVKIKKLLYKVNYDQVFKERSGQRVYLCDYISGFPHLGDAPEKDKMEKQNDLYNPRWVTQEEFKDLLIYPLEIRDLLLEDMKNDFVNNPKEMFIKADSFHHT